jgi:Tol biopolymer transport system component
MANSKGLENILEPEYSGKKEENQEKREEKEESLDYLNALKNIGIGLWGRIRNNKWARRGAIGFGLAALLLGVKYGCSGSRGNIAFNAKNDIYLTDSDGSNARNVTNTPKARELNLSWSLDGEKVVFNVEGCGNIFMINKGKTPRKIFSIKEGNYNACPALSPDGKRIAYLGGFRVDQLYVMDSEGKGSDAKRVNLKIRNYSYSNPYYTPSVKKPIRWSPDGKRIAFGYENEIGIVNSDDLDSKIVQGIAISSGYQKPGGYKQAVVGSYCWSPDGKKLAFSSLFLGEGIYVVNSDGSKLKRLTDQSDSGPEYSSNGQIAFIRKRNIWVVNDNGSKLEQLTYEEADYNPVWSPDGKRIAFERKKDIWVMNANGSGRRKVTDTPEIVESDIFWLP